MIKNILIVVTSVLILSCQTLNFPNDEVLNERENLRSQRSNIDDDWIEAGLEYDSHYASALEGNPGAKYYPVWFDSIGSRMNGLIFVPGNQTKGTIIAIHGFAGNIRGYRFYIRELLKEGYTVAALSLPGHGLAGGDRGDIENFDDYGKVVLDFISSLRGKIPEPFYAIGHSTGCTSLLIYNEKYGWDLEKIVFISPLIRSSLWYPSKITRFFFKPFIHYYNTEL
ncbi:MAG: hypothetical protein B6229_05800 [Spirochaetaceae bacterium 4572_7]|nr:MAG: hypothetical protein B6229_05800 [Spirochaetaceae bacterium 4572_7]